jgi:gliding motility-associated-like protein
MRLKIGFAFLLFGLGCGWATAQPYPSNNGTFEVDQVKGCAPFTITLTVPTLICDPVNNINCDFFYEATSIQNVFTHTYNTPGTYNLVGVFQGGITDRITITVVPDTPPEFEIYSCSGNGVQVNITDTNYDRYVIDFNDATVPVETTSLSTVTHAFTSSGNKTVTVRGRNLGAGDNCTPASKAVDAVAALPVPTITQITVLNNTDIQLAFANENNILYRLQMAANSSGAFLHLQNVYETSTTTVNNLQTDNNYYCFRLGVFDPCNNTTSYSNTICSSNLDVAALNNNNQVTWATAPAGVSSFTITRDGNPTFNPTGASTSVDDTNITCGVNYCYQQTTNYANGSTSITLPVCATAQSTNIPTVAENISAIVGTDNSVQLQWTQDPSYLASSYRIAKSVNGSFAKNYTTTTPNFTDDEYQHDVTSCYKIDYTDACNNKSPQSVDVCPIKLIPTVESDNSVTLSWTPYEAWNNGVDYYIVEKFNAQGQLLQTVNVSNGTTYTDNTQDPDNQIILYRITAIANEAGIVPAVSNGFTITKEPNLFHPTAFTPNNDGLNDTFNVIGQFIATFEMRIFNRWGEMMYVTQNLDEGWDGHYRGSLMPEGTYVFRATITDQTGRTFEESGPFVLLRRN